MRASAAASDDDEEQTLFDQIQVRGTAFLSAHSLSLSRSLLFSLSSSLLLSFSSTYVLLLCLGQGIAKMGAVILLGLFLACCGLVAVVIKISQVQLCSAPLIIYSSCAGFMILSMWSLMRFT